LANDTMPSKEWHQFSHPIQLRDDELLLLRQLNARIPTLHCHFAPNAHSSCASVGTKRSEHRAGVDPLAQVIDFTTVSIRSLL
jgi:hypothetical protein